MEELKTDWEWVEIDFVYWRSAVDKRLLDIYAISIENSGVDNECLTVHWRMKQSPYEFIDWFGMKYDLTARSEIEWGRLGTNL